ncbi:TPA: hypothetical protein ACH3X1_013675 [Trebouxia sp. C0004]
MAPVMTAVIYHKFGPPSTLEVVQDYPVPTRGAGELLVRIHATSINPLDLVTRKGEIPLAKKGKILGADLSGVVESADATSKFKPGDKVVALTDGWKAWVREGTYAQYCIAKESQLAFIPSNVSFEQAATMPEVGITAWLALEPMRSKAAGMRVLVHGGAGGVGGAAVQIAKAWGMHVTTTCSTKNLDFVCQDVGADEAVDYTSQQVDQLFKGKPFDAVIDPVGGMQEGQSLKVLAKHGYYAHVPRAGSSVMTMLNMFKRTLMSKLYIGPWYKPVFAAPSGAIMKELAELMAAGKLQAFIDKEFPLQQAVQAHQYMEAKSKPGKVVFKVQ